MATVSDWVLRFCGPRGRAQGLLRAGEWWAPSRVDLVEAGQAPELRFVFDSATRPAADDGRLLQDFINLAHDVPNEPDMVEWNKEALISFARRFGPLGLCRQHAWPITHSLSFAGRPGAPCPMRIRRTRERNTVSERALSWASYSRTARGILNLLVTPNNERELESLRRTMRRPIRHAADAIEAWLELCFFQLSLTEPPFIRLDSLHPIPPLFGQLGLALALEATRTGGAAVCVSCGDLCDLKTKPRQDRRFWCRKPECQRAQSREAQRRHREKARQGGKGDGTETQRG
jgi:hypothetical protein